MRSSRRAARSSPRISSQFDENLRVAFLAVSPLYLLGAGILFRARKFLDEDMQKIMMAVLTAMQEEQERREAEVFCLRRDCVAAERQTHSTRFAPSAMICGQR